METDKWFYKFFLSQPGMLAELLPGAEPDWEFSYSAPVIKEKEFRLDGVFKPLGEDSKAPLVFAEAQMQTEENFYRRYFSSIFLYLSQYEDGKNWRGLLILRSRRQSLGSEEAYRELLGGRVTRLYLSDLQRREGLSGNLALLQLLTVSLGRGAEIGKRVLREAETAGEFERRLSLIETILANKFPQLTQEVIMELLDLKRTDITRSRFYQQIKQEGRQEGHQEGRQEGEVQLVVRQLQRRFGELAPERAERIRALSVEQLEELGLALLDFTGPEDLERYLEDC